MHGRIFAVYRYISCPVYTALYPGYWVETINKITIIVINTHERQRTYSLYNQNVKHLVHMFFFLLSFD